MSLNRVSFSSHGMKAYLLGSNRDENALTPSFNRRLRTHEQERRIGRGELCRNESARGDQTDSNSVSRSYRADSVRSYLDLNWFGVINVSNDALAFPVPASLLFECTQCQLQLTATLAWSSSDGTRSSKASARQKGSKVVVPPPGARIGHRKAPQREGPGPVLALAYSRLGLHGVRHHSDDDREQTNVEADCTAIGFKSGHIRLYRKTVRRGDQSTSDPPDDNCEDWKLAVKVQCTAEGVKSDQQVYPSALALLPPCRSHSATADGHLMCGMSHGGVALWVLTNLLSSSAQAVLSSLVSFPSIHSPVSSLSLSFPDVPTAPARLSEDQSPPQDVVEEDSSTAFVSWDSGDVFLLRFVFTSPHFESACRRRRLWAVDPAIGQIYRCSTCSISGSSRFVVALCCTRALICLQLSPSLDVLFKHAASSCPSVLADNGGTFRAADALPNSQFSSAFVGVLRSGEGDFLTLRFVVR